MSTRSRRITRLGAACLLTALGCGEGGLEPKEPVPGNLRVRLVTPYSTDAAIRVTLTGPGIGALAPSGDRLLYSRVSSENVRAIAVFGQLTTDDLFVFAVPNVDHPELYTVRLVQVATETNALRALLTGYTLSIRD